MQGLILAAGMGNRLGSYTKDNTKCMVEVNGKKLIDYSLEALYNAGIRKTVIVIGFKGENLKKWVTDKYKEMEIIYVENSIYDKTNNIYSLWLAKDYLAGDDTLLLESDLIFDEIILKDVMESSLKNLAVVAPFENWMDGTVTLLDEDKKMVTFIPKKNFEWKNVKNYFKTVNIYKFSKEFSSETYIPFLEAYIKSMGKNEYYEQVLRVISYLEDVDFYAHIVEGERWYEIDDVQDLDIGSAIFSSGAEKVKNYQSRYGGYWRFPKLKDFCYLVNPYFPTKNMVKEMKNSFGTLVREYPSGLNVQNLLAGKMFKCDKEYILTGNGAAELIKALAGAVEGKVGAIFPTFNEYPEAFGYDRVKKYIVDNKKYSYTKEEIIEFSKDIDALVIISPDNPSGFLLDKDNLVEILEYFETNNKILIFDESFIDFAEKKRRYTLLNNEILEKYKSLIVIKSISKSYGVPGLRLGVAATSNRAIREKIKKGLSIWNINSFGEYFLQIIGKHEKDYNIACERIANERENFYKELAKIKFLKTYPSQANYILCEVKEGYTSGELTMLMLDKYDILIKDLNGKIGFENKNFIRIAVKNRKANKELVEKFKKIDKEKKQVKDEARL